MEDVDLRGGAARRGCVHAQLLPEGTSRARPARVRALHAPPHQDQGTAARGVRLPLLLRGCTASYEIAAASFPILAAM